jgi:hypothetical protein
MADTRYGVTENEVKVLDSKFLLSEAEYAGSEVEEIV